MENKPKGAKHLRTKLLILTVLPAVVVLMALSFQISLTVKNMRSDSEAAQLTKNTENVRLAVQNKLETLQNAALWGNRSMTMRNYFTTLERRSDMMINPYYEDVKQELEYTVANSDIARSAWIADYDTNVAFQNPLRWWRSDENWRLDQRPYYLKLATGWRSILTDPYQGDGANGTTISAISPVTNPSGAVIGIMGVDVDINKLALTLNNAGKAHSGTAYLITGDGYMIEYQDGKGVMVKANAAGLEYTLMNAISIKGVGTYEFEHDDAKMAGRLEFVDGTDDWMVLFMMPKSVLSGVGAADVMNIGLSFLYFTIGLSLIYVIWVRRFTKRTKLVSEVAKRVIDGETDVEFTYVTKDETGMLAHAANILADKLGAVSYAADRYTSLMIPTAKKSETEVKQLASSTADNAYSVMDIADSLRSISYNLNANAKGASHTGDRAQAVLKELNDNNKRLNSMIAVSHQTKDAISQIQKSVKIIEEIAFQTHILSLSANVEASAMEDADSSSFKVIAEEVRELARQSTGSASRTKELIIKASELAQQCVNLSEDAARSLVITADESNNIQDSIEQIARLSKEDARALTDLMANADHLSGKVNDNSNVAARCAGLMGEIAQNATELREVLNSIKDSGVKTTNEQ